MHGYVYILQSNINHSYYIGSTINPVRRLNEHNAGISKSTRLLRPWNLVFAQKYDDIKIARQMENRLKKLKSRKIIEIIIKDKYIKMGS